jgi:hypothetical protein
MMKGLFWKLLLIFSFVFQLNAFAQKPYDLIDNNVLSLQSADSFHLKQGDNVIKVSADARNYSTALPFSFVETLAQNEFVNDNLKNSASSRMKSFNYDEFGYNAGVAWYHRWSDSSIFKGATTSISLKQRSINEIRFTGDAFNLIFFGNAMYAGDSARLDGSKYLGITFRQLQFGWQKSFGTKDTSWSLFVGVSVLQGMSANSLTVAKGNLYTDPNGEYVDLNSSFLYWTSDSTASHLQTFKGIGVSGDIVLSFPVGRKGNFKFAMNDLGFIRWNKQSKGYGSDTSIHFEGVQVNNLFAFQDTSFLKVNKDTLLKRAGVKQVQQHFTTILPTVISMVYSLAVWHNQATLKAGIYYKPSFDPYPLVFVSISTYKLKFVYPSIMVSAGGSQGFNAGIALSKIISKRIYITVGSENILGIVAPNQFTSASAFAALSVKF